MAYLATALKMNLGELGICVFLRILGYCNTFFVFFSRLKGEGRMQSGRGSGGQKSLPPEKEP